MHQSEEQHDKLWRTLGIALGVILLHGLFFLLFDHLPQQEIKKAPVKIQHITVAKGQLTKSQKQPRVAQSKTQKRPDKKKEEEKKVDINKLDAQIVDLPPSPDNRPPDEAKYLSSYNTRTEKETRAKNPDKDYQKAANKKSGQNKAVPPKGEMTGKKLAQPQEQPQTGADVPAIAPTVPQPKVDLPTASDGLLANRPQTAPRQGSTSKYHLKLNPTPTLPEETAMGLESGVEQLKIFPDMAQMQQILGSPANNYLPDVEEGEGTFLNSREFKYASFFNRIHQNVSSNWYPQEILGTRDPTGNMYGYKDRLTVVNVVLNANGTLLDARIAQPSGVHALDDEAVAAFKRASPFPNPPAALLDSQGRIEFKFGFMVEYNRFSLGRI